MDMTNSIVPKSDQINADDLMTGPITVTVAKVSAGSAEQPVDVHLVEFPGRAFRPSKSMRRVMVAAWGAETSVYTGHRLTLYRDPKIRFGKDEVGGIRISHMSHIDKSLKIALTVTRGRREAFSVDPLSNGPTESEHKPAPTRTELEDAGGDFGPGVGSVMSDKQMSLIGMLFGKLGMYATSVQLAYVSDVIERPITDAKQLTMYEASRLISYLKKDEKEFDQARLAAEAERDGIEQ